ncbi:hypothetical protein DFH29DRAFT_1071564 [Suillus ampliporus]|nr:hypothetical protein DFH29DRAFT_1071564 [Suillus ampliporus]
MADVMEVGAPPTVPRHLLSPPQDLAECIFPDAFVFPPLPEVVISPPDPISSPSLPLRPPPSQPSTPRTVESVFQQFCHLGMYSNRRWTPSANAPDFWAEHIKATEPNYAKFINTLVNKAIQVTGIGPFDRRRWTAEHSGNTLPGSPDPRKPDIYAINDKYPSSDWRAVDCVIEIKSGASDKDDAFSQVSERAKTIFSVQDDRRFAILICIKHDQFSYVVFDRGGSIWTPFISINTEGLLFLRLILGISLADWCFIGYDTSVSGRGVSRQVRLDLASMEQGLRDLAIQLILHMTAEVNSRGSTVQLLKVTNSQVADFYGHDGDGYKSPPGIATSEVDSFGIICKDIWEDPDNGLSEGLILQLLHAKGVRGVVWCLDEKPVVIPDVPPLPPNIGLHPGFMPQPFLDNSMYIRSRWGIRALKIPQIASSASWKEKQKQTPLSSPDPRSISASASHLTSVPQMPIVSPGDEVNAHQEACSDNISGKAAKLRILHQDLSIWNMMMVGQARSDWCNDWEWKSLELQQFWASLPKDHRSKIHRSLLIDWGFAAIEKVDSNAELIEDDVKVYHPTKWVPPPSAINVVSHESETTCHCLPGDKQVGDAKYSFPSLWDVQDDKICSMNTQFTPGGAKDGHVDVDWVNTILRNEEHGLTNAMGTWPFISLDVMASWLTSTPVVIQPWHDLEMMFISFTALCIWFASPYCAKLMSPEAGGFAWIFEPHQDSDSNSAYCKWQWVLLTKMHDMCFAPSWGDENDKSPSGFKWPEDVPHVTHEGMLEAVESAILTLLKEGDKDRFQPQMIPTHWTDAHAHIDDDGIFNPPPSMSKTFLPVVVDGINSLQPLGTSGLFDQVRPVPPDPPQSTYPSSIIPTTVSSARSELCSEQ